MAQIDSEAFASLPRMCEKTRANIKEALLFRPAVDLLPHRARRPRTPGRTACGKAHGVSRRRTPTASEHDSMALAPA